MEAAQYPKLQPHLAPSIQRSSCQVSIEDEKLYPNTDIISRYLHLKLLVYRPTLSAYCSAAMSTFGNAQPDSWSIIYQQNAALRCVQAACDLIHSLSKATTEDSTGAWWYGVFCSYPYKSLWRWLVVITNCSLDLISAGIVLVLTESSGADFSGITSVQLENSWNECLETLNRMIGVHPSARDYCIALDELRHSHTAKLSRSETPLFYPLPLVILFV